MRDDHSEDHGVQDLFRQSTAPAAASFATSAASPPSLSKPTPPVIPEPPRRTGFSTLTTRDGWMIGGVLAVLALVFVLHVASSPGHGNAKVLLIGGAVLVVALALGVWAASKVTPSAPTAAQADLAHSAEQIVRSGGTPLDMIHLAQQRSDAADRAWAQEHPVQRALGKRRRRASPLGIVLGLVVVSVRELERAGLSNSVAVGIGAVVTLVGGWFAWQLLSRPISDLPPALQGFLGGRTAGRTSPATPDPRNPPA